MTQTGTPATERNATHAELIEDFVSISKNLAICRYAFGSYSGSDETTEATLYNTMQSVTRSRDAAYERLLGRFDDVAATRSGSVPSRDAFIAMTLSVESLAARYELVRLDVRERRGDSPADGLGSLGSKLMEGMDILLTALTVG